VCAPRTLVIASRNAGKVAELGRLLAAWGIDSIRGIADFSDAPAPVESGASYAENARIKAASAVAATGMATLADDSGLEVDALGGRPGLHSARYGGPGLTDAMRVARLLADLDGVPAPARGAAFRAVVVLAWPDGRTLVAEGACRGRILDAPRGLGGFGYDPVFFDPGLGRTFAEISADEKARVDHRGRAIGALGEALTRACPGPSRSGPARDVGER
jgi:XTP/dITP diphosphohydrolase